MPTDNIYSSTSFLTDWRTNEKYFKILSLLASLSRLFSENTIPYLDYRLAENIFCKYFSALNDARSCTAYDARIGQLGIGIKTFGLKNNSSVEKIAEFNKLKPRLIGLKGIDLARQLGEFRNDRMRFANDTYNISNTLYHIVGRDNSLLRIFNTPYEEVDLANIHILSNSESNIKFEDGKNIYSFNQSKSVLMKQFTVASDYRDVDISIIEDPLALLEEFFANYIPNQIKYKGIDYVILPLYNEHNNIVPLKSGLNQWNAGGRARNENEVYISVPRYIHNYYENFFPDRNTEFVLMLPDGKKLSAKICQSGDKALMSNPNSDLGEWILRKVLHKKIGELVTIDDLNRFGIDSVMVVKEHKKDENDKQIYSISFCSDYESYSEFKS
ncbi:MAG: NgoFVII family restriction endonuclease [Muribaculaceae bacterium]|nr:NgoFVII family restriction endonuclease [Muribaculaceae bacterium]